MRAKFEIGDKVRIKTADGMMGTVVDRMLNDDNTFYYQLKTAFNGWFYAEFELEKMHPVHAYSLDCDYYNKVFPSLDALLQDVMTSGMDPNYFITYNGKVQGEMAIDLIQF